MADLRTLKKHEVTLTLKKVFAMVRTLTYNLSYWNFFLSFIFYYYYYCYYFTYIAISSQEIQTTNITKEWVDHAYSQLKDEEARRVSAIKTLVVAIKKIKDLGTKLTEADKERKNVEIALADAMK